MAQEKYGLRLPEYPGASQCVKIPRAGAAAAQGADPAGIRASYTLAEDTGGLSEQDVLPDPIAQVRRGRAASITVGMIEERAASAGWAAQTLCTVIESSGQISLAA